jgi:hypothetical protein
MTEHAKRITNSLKTTTDSYFQHPVKPISSATAAALNGDSNLIVTLGPEALDEVLSGPGSAPVLAVFVSKISFDSTQVRYKDRDNRQVSAIFSDPDPLKQVALVKALYGPAASSVLISSPTFQTYVTDYQAAADIFNIELRIIDINVISSSSDLILATKDTNSLLLLKDHSLFKKVSLEKVLLSSYDINRQGVIGYSRGLVKNGAAATTYSSVDNIAHSIYLQSNRLSGNQSIKPPHYTESFEVSLNKYVLRSLDLIAPSEETVLNKVTSMIMENSK